MIMEFNFKGVDYEAEVDNFELWGIYYKGSRAPVPYNYELYSEAEDLIMNDIVTAAEMLYDMENNR